MDTIDLTGKSTPLGLAFAIADDVMLTSCNGISPGMELSVRMVPRHVQARVMTADEGRALCRLTVAGSGGWPLVPAGADPRPGDKVYSARINAVGEATLTEGRLKRVVEEGKSRAYETTLAMPPEGRGGPLLDASGRIVAIATVLPGGDRLRFIGMPPQWSSVPRTQGKAPAPKAAPAPDASSPPGTGSAPEGDAAPLPRKGSRFSKEREDAIGKAFRPPPSVPDDL
jgi:hypothetical protein